MQRVLSLFRTKRIAALGIFLLLLISQSLRIDSKKPSTQVEGTSTSIPPTVTPLVLSPLPTPPIATPSSVLLLRVVDGDTIDVEIEGKKDKVRLIGINTPETADPRKPVECLAEEAKAFMTTLLPVGVVIQLQADHTQGDRDKYNRLLRFVFINGKDIGKALIEAGFAQEYTYNKPYRYQIEYKNAQEQAREQKKGLWADAACSTVPRLTIPVTSPQSIRTNSSVDRDCNDFSTQKEAQEYFNSRGGSPTHNVDMLDGSDRDGVVCESLR